MVEVTQVPIKDKIASVGKVRTMVKMTKVLVKDARTLVMESRESVKKAWALRLVGY